MSNTTRNPLLDEAPEDTMNNVADVLEYLSVSLVVLSKTGISAGVASGMSHVRSVANRRVQRFKRPSALHSIAD